MLKREQVLNKTVILIVVSIVDHQIVVLLAVIHHHPQLYPLKNEQQLEIMSLFKINRKLQKLIHKIQHYFPNLIMAKNYKISLHHLK